MRARFDIGLRAAAALAVAVVMVTVLPLLAPQFTGRFVDDAIAGAGAGRLTMIALGYLVVAVAGQAARMLTAWLARRAAWDATNRLRETLAGHALGLDMAYHGRHTPGEMIERVDGDVAAIADFAVAFLLDVVASVLLLGGVLVVVCVIDPRIGAVLLAYCLLIGYAMTRVQRRAVPSATLVRATDAEMIGTLEERLAGAEDIRANGAGEHTVNGFYGAAAAWFHAEYRAGWIGSGLVAGTSITFALGTATVLGMAAWAQLSAGTAVLLFQYTMMVRTPFERLIDQLRQYQAALAGFARVRALLSEQRTLPAPADPRPLPGGALGLEIDHVGFAYDGAFEVLTDVALTLAPGQTLGLVGRTGSGKTTIGRLILRLYDPGRGAVRVGGIDLREADPASLRRRVCAVTQDVQLFAGTVRDNLTLFRPLADDDRLRAALAEVGLDGWDLDMRLDGQAFSAGEAQLLAFARALLADPGLVVLDEPSSRLDPATERSVERSVERLLAGRTGVLIAHRLSSLSRVDAVAVVEGGRIVECGPREALLGDPASRFSRMHGLAEAAR
ncbi:ABC transporter ATP-binding protein [Streptosporangiaceae bacterium NEAU-GS5]|nr:ABC transporter ATP-binding protein [Streptosporangiaceae bacterium NEAU-GS5]